MGRSSRVLCQWALVSILASALLASQPARAISLGGTEVAPDKFVVYLLIGTCVMAGRTGAGTGDTVTSPYAWNYKFDNGTNAWIPAKSPLHPDGGGQGDGPGMPFLKKMIALYPGYYFGAIQNADSGAACYSDYRKGKSLYNEIITLTKTLQAQAPFTIGGVLVMLGVVESESSSTAKDFANQVKLMVSEMRADLGLPNLPFLIQRLSNGYTYWTTVRDQVDTLPPLVPYFGIVPSDGPYISGNPDHFTWQGEVLWGEAAASLIKTNSWFPSSSTSASIVVTPTSGLTTTESGGTATFTVVLGSAPASGVVIPVVSNDTTEGLVSPASLSFSPANWSAAQTVVVTGVDDAAVDGTVNYSVALGPTTSLDPSFNGLPGPTVQAKNLDNDSTGNQPPKAVITGPTNLTAKVSGDFYGGNSTDDGSIVSYAWSFGDGATAAGQMVSHAWSTAGTYTVTLTVTDDGGVQAGATWAVQVGSALKPSISLLSPIGGEVWAKGSAAAIKWTAKDLTNVRIDFSSDGGTTWSWVAFSDVADPAWGSLDWPVPDLDSSDCRIMVQGYNFEAPVESAPFTVGDAGTLLDGVHVIGGCTGVSPSAGALCSLVFLLATALGVWPRRRRPGSRR